MPRLSRTLLSAALLAIVFLAGLGHAARADDDHPLRPIDTSSPRASLQSFLKITDDVYRRTKAIFDDYANSDALYPTAEQWRMQARAYADIPAAVRIMDVSNILPVLRDSLSVERMLQFREILDRIDLPDFADIPDRAEMARTGAKRWRIPDTELAFVLMEDGPRAGEFLLSAGSVDRLPEFYERVKALPYKPGPGKQLSELYNVFSRGHAATVYDAYSTSPAGLGMFVPPRWLLRMPGWLRIRVAEVALWQWIGLGIGLLIGSAVVIAGKRLAHSLSRGSEDDPDRGWSALPVPLAILFVASVVLPVWLLLFRVSGTIRIVLEFAQTGITILSLAWLSIIGCTILAELIVSSDHLKHSSLDSQLIRLGMRLAGTAGAIALVIQGADELGFPAYSVVAGLGVGGLAIALAARETLANLLGSMLIMFEKPFRIGHVIRIGTIEGTVEDVGFRSTRIRTPDNSLISIPSNAVVNSTVENLSLRPLRRQRFFVQVTYDTPREKLQALIAGIQRILDEHPLTKSTNYQVRLNNLSDSSLDILVLFHLEALDYTTELREREAILFKIMELAEELAISFAFPTRTLHVAPAENQAAPVSVPSGSSR